MSTIYREEVPTASKDGSGGFGKGQGLWCEDEAVSKDGKPHTIHGAGPAEEEAAWTTGSNIHHGLWHGVDPRCRGDLIVVIAESRLPVLGIATRKHVSSLPCKVRRSLGQTRVGRKDNSSGRRITRAVAKQWQ